MISNLELFLYIYDTHYSFIGNNFSLFVAHSSWVNIDAASRMTLFVLFFSLTILSEHRPSGRDGGTKAKKVRV